MPEKAKEPTNKLTQQTTNLGSEDLNSAGGSTDTRGNGLEAPEDSSSNSAGGSTDTRGNGLEAPED